MALLPTTTINDNISEVSRDKVPLKIYIRNEGDDDEGIAHSQLILQVSVHINN